jgi:hypothetical protein
MHDFESSLFCIALGASMLIGFLTLSWVWALLTLMCVLAIGYYGGLNQLLDRTDIFDILVKVGILIMLFVVPVSAGPGGAWYSTSLDTTTTLVTTLLVSFGLTGTLWFIWKVYTLPADFERQDQLSEDNRHSLVDPMAYVLTVSPIAFCLHVILGSLLPDAVLVLGTVGVFAGLWIGTGSAFLWVTLRG